MKKFTSLLVIFLMIFSAAAVTACGGKSSDGVEVEYISAAEVEAALEEGDETQLIIDVRASADYDASHIPGAVSVDMVAAEQGGLEAGIEAMTSGLTEATGSAEAGELRLVLACYNGGGYAQAAANALNAMGANMENVFNLDGGFEEWSKKYPDIAVGGESISGVEMKFMTAGEVQAAAGSSEYLLIDVRRSDDFAAGHVAGAVNVDMEAAAGGDIVSGLTDMKLGLLRATGSANGGGKKLVLIGYEDSSYVQLATSILSACGLDTAELVRTMEGGFGSWSGAVEK